MDKNLFIEHEYNSLRTEILDAKNRIFKLAGIGLLGMPTALYLVKKHEIIALALTLPLFFFALTILFVVESKTLMRAGRYIRLCIEPLVLNDDVYSKKGCNSGCGWESWLQSEKEQDPLRRAPDRYLSGFFIFVTSLYYIISVSIAVEYAWIGWKTTGAITAFCVYFLLTPFVIYYILKIHKNVTGTERDSK